MGGRPKGRCRINLRMFSLSVVFCILQARAGILFDPERNALWVTDYPPELPCTLAQVARVDQVFGWGKVRKDPAARTYHLDCNLLIGANDGTDAVLRLGADDGPPETLVMHGNIYVHPYFIQDRNPGAYWTAPKRRNALQLGDPGRAYPAARVLFACSPGERYTLYCGQLPWVKAGQYGGGLYVYGGEIAALNPAYPIGDADTGGMVLAGSTVLVGARLANVKGALRGLSMGGVNTDYLLSHTLFEAIGIPLLNGRQQATGCTFRHCGTAVRDWGGLNATLAGCVFQQNERNWELTHTDDGLVLIDCEWDAPRQGDLYQARTNRAGTMQHPKLSVRRSLAVEVRDSAGTPVQGADVTFKAEQEGCDLLQLRTVKTDANGRTPGPGAAGAIVLTEHIKTASVPPADPTVQVFTYTLSATHRGQTMTATGIRPGADGARFVMQFKQP